MHTSEPQDKQSVIIKPGAEPRKCHVTLDFFRQGTYTQCDMNVI